MESNPLIYNNTYYRVPTSFPPLPRDAIVPFLNSLHFPVSITLFLLLKLMVLFFCLLSILGGYSRVLPPYGVGGRSVWYVSNCAFGVAVSDKQSWHPRLPVTQGILLGKPSFLRHPEAGKVTGEEQGLEKEGEGLRVMEAEQYITEDNYRRRI